MPKSDRLIPVLAALIAAIAAPAAKASGVPPTAFAANDLEPLPVPDPAGSSAFPPDTGSTAPARPDQPRWALFGQTTFTAMTTLGFRNPQAGAQSVLPNDLRETFDATLYAGVRAWTGAEIWTTAEVDQGFGVGNAHGLAGFPSGEAYKLGKAQPYSRIQRLYLRQTIALGGESTPVEAAANQMAGTQTANRLVITLGKFSVVDVFDANQYAHDPRGDLLNWSVIDAGAFDYAGDPWGYSYGGSAELYLGRWALRAGLFNLTDVPGGGVVTTDFSFYQAIGEIEHRHAWHAHPGKVRAALWLSHGRLGSYTDAIAWGLANATAPDVSQVQVLPRNRLGGYVNAEQELTTTLGAFLRASKADGRYAAWDFTDIDTSVSAGLALAGKAWHRPQDTLDLAIAVNTISNPAKAYLAAGGMGLLIGDGTLPRPGAEALAEASYTLRPIKAVAITFDAQIVANPAYNRDRGPVPLLAIRLHGAF